MGHLGGKAEPRNPGSRVPEPILKSHFFAGGSKKCRRDQREDFYNQGIKHEKKVQIALKKLWIFLAFFMNVEG